MVFAEDGSTQKPPQHEVVQKSKSEAQINEVVKSPKSRPKSATKKLGKGSAKSKVQLKRERKHFAIVDEIPIIEMKSECKKDQLQRQTHVQMEDWYPQNKGSTEQLKRGKMSSPMLNRTMSTVSSLSRRVSDAARIGIGQQKRKLIKDRASESSVQGNVNTVNTANTVKLHVGVTGSPYACGSGLPDGQSYLNITAKEFL